MTRYRVAVGKHWLAAVYDDRSNGVMLTDKEKDACSWATHEKALGAYALACALYTDGVQLQAVEEPDCPASWGAKKQDSLVAEAPSV
jgi:hypothetical protein